MFERLILVVLLPIWIHSVSLGINDVKTIANELTGKTVDGYTHISFMKDFE